MLPLSNQRRGAGRAHTRARTHGTASSDCRIQKWKTSALHRLLAVRWSKSKEKMKRKGWEGKELMSRRGREE